MSKQTAVEWVVDKLSLLNLEIHLHPEKYNVDEAIREKNKILQQAKAMEMEQSIFDYCEGFKASAEGWNGEHGLNNMLDVAKDIDAEDYYNITYGGDK